MAGQQQERGGDELFWIGAAIVALLGLGLLAEWFREELYGVFGALAAVHVAPFAWAAEAVPFLARLDVPFGDAVRVHDFLGRGGYARMSGEQAAVVNRTAAICAMPVYIGPVVWVAFRALRVRPEEVYARRHNMDSMIAEHARTWWTGRLARSIQFLKEPEFDLRRTADEVGRRRHSLLTAEGGDLGLLLLPSAPAVAPPCWARSLRPEEWLVAIGTTYDEDVYSRLAGSTDRTAPVSFTNEGPEAFEFRDGWESVTIATVRELLQSDLGPVWEGRADRLPPHLRAFMSICARFLDFDTAGGNALLRDLAALYELVCRDPVGTFDRILVEEPGLMAGVDGVLRSRAGLNLFERMKEHYYLHTACCRMLEVARKDRGVLAGASFQWLKRENRPLWYALAALGSEVASIEGAAVIAHYRAEVQYEAPIIRPALYQAARAVVEDYLDMHPERIEARRVKEDKSRTPGEKLRAIFENPELLQDEEEAKAEEAARADLGRDAGEEESRSSAALPWAGRDGERRSLPRRYGARYDNGGDDERDGPGGGRRFRPRPDRAEGDGGSSRGGRPRDENE